MLESLRDRVRILKHEVHALYFAVRHPGTPWYAKLLAGLVVAYALSPIDLIPDFIPVLGYLDDLVLVPLGITAAIKLVPAEVMAECRARAQSSALGSRRAGVVVAVLIVACWVALGAWAAHWMLAP
jgi:uncharacterized membrane protein YkvA (DUF1232 family)